MHDMSGARSVTREIVDTVSIYREEAMKGLQTCLSLCVEAPTEQKAPTEQSEFEDELQASFDRFITACQCEESWKAGMISTMQAFMQNMKDFAGRRKVAHMLLHTLPEGDHRSQQEIEQEQIIKKHAQQTIENYMLLVNASFLLEYWRASRNIKFEFMCGIEFPGLWSRSLYSDTTPKKIYRNMLVGNRPRGFSCDKRAAEGWELMLWCTRMVINGLIAAADRSLLSEYETNLRYACNEIQNEDTVYLPQIENSMSDVDTWTIPAGEGFIKYDVRADNLMLPPFLGTPCGAVFRSGYIYMLTREGEIFRLQLEHCVCENGEVVSKPLLYDLGKCIVEAPNKCIIQRVHFEKGTEEFPALVSMWDRWTYLGLMPTCLVAAPLGKLLVVSCRLKAIYEIDANSSARDSSAGIKLHAGQPDVDGQDELRLAVPERARGTEYDRNQATVRFHQPRCALLDGKSNLWVCDGGWLRKLTYDKNDATRNTFTVSNEQNLHAEPTSIALGSKGFVILEHYWDMQIPKKYKPRLLDVQWVNVNTREGTLVSKIRKTSLIKNVGHNDVGSIILDSKDQIIFCPRNILQCVDRADYTWGGSSSAPFPYRENDEGTDDVTMKDLGFGGNLTCHLTWYRGNIAVFTKSKDGGPILALVSRNTKRAAGGAADGDEAQRAVRPRTGALDALLHQLAHMHVSVYI